MTWQTTLRFDSAKVVAVADVDSKRLYLGNNLLKAFTAKKTGNSNYVNVKTYGDYKELLLR